MTHAQFYFANIEWLIGLLAIPIMCLLYKLYYRSNANIKNLEKFADKHLIPHLLRSSKTGQISIWRSMFLGSLLWSCLMAAMADPRFGIEETQSYKEDKTLVILLDLSKSMDANDISPSRLARARQEIENIVNMSKGVKMGLVGFAADAHIIAPITDDINNIRHLLPLIGTDLVYIQGSRIMPALKTAQQMLLAEPGSNKSILVISDGEFQDEAQTGNLLELVSNLAKAGIVTHTLGTATVEGAVFQDNDGAPMKRGNKTLVTQLEKAKLEELSNHGLGQYFDTHYTNINAEHLLKLIDARKTAEIDQNHHTNQSQEWFYVFVLPLVFIILLWFRKGFTFPIILLMLLTPVNSAQGSHTSAADIFLNKEQLAKKSFEEIDDSGAVLSTFTDPYKRGVAYYRAGKYKEAEESFCQNTRPEVQESALYNLATSLARQDKLDEAIEVYKKILAQNPNHEKTRHNLGIVQSMIFVVQEKEKKEDKKKKPSDPGEGLGGGGGGCGDDEDDEEDEGGGDDKEDKKDDGDKDDDKKDKDDNKGGGNEEEKSDQEDGGDDAGGGQADETMTDDKAEQLLDLIGSNHKNFLQNQFYLESVKNQTKATVDPW